LAQNREMISSELGVRSFELGAFKLKNCLE